MLPGKILYMTKQQAPFFYINTNALTIQGSPILSCGLVHLPQQLLMQRLHLLPREPVWSLQEASDLAPCTMQHTELSPKWRPSCLGTLRSHHCVLFCVALVGSITHLPSVSSSPCLQNFRNWTQSPACARWALYHWATYQSWTQSSALIIPGLRTGNILPVF